MKHATCMAAGLVLLVLLAATPAAAVEWQVGFKGGLAIADLTGDDVNSDETGKRTGFVGGAFGQADFSQNFGLRLEALYHMKGAEADSADFTATIKLDYVEFPILLVGQIPASESASLSAFAGPVVAFNTKSEIEGSVDGLSATVDISDYTAGFEFGLAMGLGACFEAGPVVITLDGRYDLGLTSVFDVDDADIKNQGFSFMAGVGFPVGGE